MQLTIDGTSIGIPESRILAVECCSDGRRNGLLWGAGFGAVFAVLGTVLADDCHPATCVGISLAVGAGLGFGIDTLATRRTLVFERRAAAVRLRHRRRAFVTPIVGVARRGVSLTFQY